MTQGDGQDGADAPARRAYWAAQLDEADAFMRRILAQPVEECGEPVVPLPGAARDAGVEVVFSDTPHADGGPRRHLLRQGLVAAFLAAAREMNDRGWILKVEDGYRTRAMQRGLGLQERLFRRVLDRTCWELGGALPSPALLLKRLGALVAQSPKTGTHMSGSAVDITVLRRDDGLEVDRGAPYLALSEATPMESPFVPAPARANRLAITALMARHGFTTYPWEFWHYNAGDAYAALLGGSGRPARYGAVRVDEATGQVSPVERPCEPLVPEEEARALMERALAARRAGD